MSRINIKSRKILIIDDEESICNLLEVVLMKEQFTNIFKTHTGMDGISKCKEIDPDLLILDIMLPDIDGYEVCKQIRKSTMAPILFLSAKQEEIDRVLSFTVGGDDYISKPFSPREVIARVNAALRRLDYYENQTSSKEIISFGDFYIDLQKREVYRGNSVIELTSKEYLLFEYLAKNIDCTLSKEQIVNSVWGSEYDGYDNTVMVHIRRIREKIEKDPSNPHYLITVKGRGYRLQKVGN